MDQKTNDATRRKIEKLLRLSRGTSNVAEAESALLKAQQMMIQAGIDAGSFKEAPEAKREVITISVPPLKTEPWARTLGAVIAKNFRCYVYWHSGWGMRFAGLAGDAMVCVEVYKAAVAHARNLARFYVESRKDDWEPQVRCQRLGDYVNMDSITSHFQREEGVDFFAPLTGAEDEDTYTYWGYKRKQYHLPITKGERGVVLRSFLRGFVDGLRQRFQDQVSSQNYGLILVQPQELIEHKATLNTHRMRNTSVRTLGTATADGMVAGRSFSPFYSSGQLGS